VRLAAVSVTTEFLEPGELRDGELQLILTERVPANPAKRHVPAYNFTMTIAERGDVVGEIGLRLGDSDFVIRYAGQLGYGVDEPYRGRHFAARSCRLLFPLARAHGFRELWITCDPANLASRRTCELSGGELVEIVTLPEDVDMYAKGERLKCRYRIAL
jgi:tagatose 1,6-diphosphate aldolase